MNRRNTSSLKGGTCIFGKKVQSSKKKIMGPKKPDGEGAPRPPNCSSAEKRGKSNTFLYFWVERTVEEKNANEGGSSISMQKEAE